MFKVKSLIFRKVAGASPSALSRFPYLIFLLSSVFALAFASTCFSQTELGSEDDLTVLGANGTPVDPDVEVKGFSVFGSTQSAPALLIPAAPGNIFINGYVQVSSGMYVSGSSTFTAGVYVTGISSFAAGPGSIYIKDGASGQVLKKVAGGAMQWADDAGGVAGSGTQYRIPLWNTDTTLTNSVMNQDAGGNSVTLMASTLTVGGAQGIYANRLLLAAGVEISSSPAAQYGGVYVSTHIYVSSNVYVGQNALYVGGGVTDQILKKNAGGWLAWGDDVTGLVGGTQYRIPIWTSATTQSSSVMGQSATSDGITLLNSTLTVQGSAFSVGGSTLTVAYGNVGIGTAVPGSRLEVAGGSVTFRGSDSNSAIAGFVDGSNNYRMVVSTAGDVGIGTTVPAHKLHIAGNAIVTSSLSVSGTGLPGTEPVFQVVGGTLTVLANGRVGIGTVAPGSRLEVAGGSVTFRGSDSNSAIAGFVDGSNNYRMVVSTAGNVGIGTTVPAHKLHIAGNAIVTSSLSVSGTGLPGTEPVFQVIGGTMTVLTNGNVGVGLAAPAAKLHVQAYEAGTNTLYISTAATAGEYSIAVSSKGITNIRNLVIENRTSAPPSPVTGQIWMRTDY